MADTASAVWEERKEVASGPRGDVAEEEETVRTQVGDKRKSSDATAQFAEEPEKKKFSMGFQIKKTGSSFGESQKKLDDSKKSMTVAPIKMTLNTQKPKESPKMKKASASVAQAFNQDDDDSEEEMPPEAKMRMRNIGRDTPTAAGPNSFGKGNLGFCDRQRIIQREIQAEMDKVSEDAAAKKKSANF